MERQLDYLIIGAGPAGLQLGYCLQKTGRDYLILEAGAGPGTFFKSLPRHRKLLSINKVYTGYEETDINLRWDWNSLLSDNDELLFKNYSKRYFPDAAELVEYLEHYAAVFDLKIKYNARVVEVTRPDIFRVLDSEGNIYSCARLIVATGVSEMYIPSIPGIELAEKYTEVSIDPNDFANKRVLIIGKGNSGFETAENLIETAAFIHIVSPHPIKMAWKSKYLGHLRAVNNNFLDTYQLKSQNVVMDATVEKIERRNGQFAVSLKYAHAQGEEEVLIYDRVIACTGFRFDNSVFDEGCRPATVIDGRLPDQTFEWESTNVKDLFFAGNLMQMRDYKKKQSAFIHGFRYNVRALHNILEARYYGTQWPCYSISATPEAIMEAVIRRANANSALWQQTGFLCDMIQVSNDGKSARYHEELPVDYVHNSEFGKQEHYYTITLEFGLDIIAESPDTFAMERIHKDYPDRASDSSAIHPILRRFCRGRKVSEHHIIEDLASEWKEDVHILPLIEFFKKELYEPAKALTV